jgi:enoyl-CoA hydratase/carnithine racemase
VIWPLLIGINRAKHLLKTGEILAAAQAERFSLEAAAMESDDFREAIGRLGKR